MYQIQDNWDLINTFKDDWLSKTSSIKDVFHELVDSGQPNKNNPCIEWYQSDEVMVCMVKA